MANTDVAHRIALDERKGEYCECIFIEVSSYSKSTCCCYTCHKYKMKWFCSSIEYVKIMGTYIDSHCMQQNVLCLLLAQWVAKCYVLEYCIGDWLYFW